MELMEHRCKRCGGELIKTNDNRWKCPYCASTYDEEVAVKNTESLRDLFDAAKLETVCNARRNLYDAVNADFISNTDVKNACTELKKYLPDDFAANFYETATSNNVKRITKLIRHINVEENYDELSSAIRFLIKSLQTEYLLELNNLVERAYKSRDLALFEKYSTAISIEAEKVVNGVYETKMPREVFIAYSSKDMDKVSELCEILEEQGLRCFVAARNLRHGKGSVENYERLLREAMDHCKTFVFVSSANSRSFNCDALIKELPYIQQKDLENAPAETKNNYASIPHKFKKPRVEYRIEESDGFNAADSISNEFFDGYERVYSPEAVAERIAKQLVAISTVKETPKPEPKPVPAPAVTQAAATAGQANVDTLIKRALIFIDDGDLDSADRYCERALDMDPENAKAYVIKLMIDLDVRVQDDLAKCEQTFEENVNFKKAIRYGDEELIKLLNGYVESVQKRINDEERIKKYEPIYQYAINTAEKFKSDFYDLDYRVRSINWAIEQLESIPKYKDSLEKAEEYKQYLSTLNNQGKKSGCYIATCVYGSYDCPQVWTLRRYRDNILSSTWYGRWFIQIYYTISPILVKWFGKTSWFKYLWKGNLDRLINKLKAEGVEDTPYQDQIWR